MAATETLPTMVLGDFNDSLEAFPTISSAIGSGALVDVGSVVELAGQGAPEITCVAHGSSKGTRRDFCLVTPIVLRWLSSFRVCHGAGYDVHAP
eukprot:10504611-Alexandrium_andersonii.AAC.1